MWRNRNRSWISTNEPPKTIKFMASAAMLTDGDPVLARLLEGEAVVGRLLELEPEALVAVVVVVETDGALAVDVGG